MFWGGWPLTRELIAPTVAFNSAGSGAVCHAVNPVNYLQFGKSSWRASEVVGGEK